MGPELVWKAVLQWPVVVLCTAIAIHWLFRWKRPSSALVDRSAALRAPSRGSRFVPIVAVLLPVAVSEAVQEAITLRELFAQFPTTVSYGALPWAMLAAVAVAIAVGNGSGALSRVAAAILVPSVALVFLSPPGLGGGVPQLVALAIAAVAAMAACSVSGRPGPAPLLGWWLVFAVASVMVLLSGFAKLAVVLGALSAMAATLAVCAAAIGRPTMGNGLAVTLATALAAGAFLGCGYDESSFPRWTWALLASAPAATALVCVPMVKRHPRLRFTVIVLGPSAVAVLALAAAMLATASTASPSDSAVDPYASALLP
jgi:hypothetical protein